MSQMELAQRLSAKPDFSQILACTPFFMPCSHMLCLTLVVVQVIFRTNQVVVPVTVRAGRDVAACVARLVA